MIGIAAIVVWTTITTLTSTNRPLSMETMKLVIASVVLFIAYLVAAPKMPLAAGAAILSAAIPNACMLLLQWFDIFNIVNREELASGMWGQRYGLTGLLGNANDAGVYLLVTLIVAASLAMESRGGLRRAAIAMTALIAVGMFATVTLTTMIAAIAAFGVLAMARVRARWRFALVALAIAIVFAGIAMSSSAIRKRVHESVGLVRSGNVSRALSGRPNAWLAAWRMFAQHPLVGVGPGCFKYQFFDEKIGIARDHPMLGMELWQNFGEAHNDHLQVLAETGLPGYALFLFVIGLVGMRSFRRCDPNDERARFVHTVALPAVTGLLVSAIAQFPMELSATRIAYLFLFAMCCGWCPESKWSAAS